MFYNVDIKYKGGDTNMFFPIIKVKDKRLGYDHIVGTNSHDLLYVDEETGGIQYLNLQCMAGTKVYSKEKDNDYQFIGNQPDECMPYVTIEYVNFEELIDMAVKNMHEQTEAKIKMDQMIKKYVEEREKCQDKLENSIQDTSGILPF
jgi:hypothetical protein